MLSQDAILHWASHTGLRQGHRQNLVWVRTKGKKVFKAEFFGTLGKGQIFHGMEILTNNNDITAVDADPKNYVFTDIAKI